MRLLREKPERPHWDVMVVLGPRGAVSIAKPKGHDHWICSPTVHRPVDGPSEFSDGTPCPWLGESYCSDYEYGPNPASGLMEVDLWELLETIYYSQLGTPLEAAGVLP